MQVSVISVPSLLVTFVVVSANYVVYAKESEIFSSIAELERLYRNEAAVVKQLDEYASVLARNLHVIKK